jgi:Txe/YoeB family toxin of Txe-Axe toxin-antitoxin module
VDGWGALKAEFPDEMSEIESFLKQRPADTLATGGKCKKLKGRLSGYWQYDVSYSHRVRYEIDKSASEVRIVYAGDHP